MLKMMYLTTRNLQNLVQRLQQGDKGPAPKRFLLGYLKNSDEFLNTC